MARTRLAGALALLGALAFAESTGAQAVGGPGGPGSTVGPGVAAGPRFSLRTLTFQALDETGWDWPGADEVAFGSALGYKLISRECGNVNSDGNAESEMVRRSRGGSRRRLQSRLGLHEAGMPGPISFVIGAYEQDDWSGFCATSHAARTFVPQISTHARKTESSSARTTSRSRSRCSRNCGSQAVRAAAMARPRPAHPGRGAATRITS